MPKNSRDFIRLLEKKAPEELLWGEKLVDSKFEATNFDGNWSLTIDSPW
jgi:hypothetical protein